MAEDLLTCRLPRATVRYRERGDGVPIVIIHGFSLDSRQMVGCMEPVFERRTGWRRLYPDLPGMGGTRGEDWINGSDEMLEVVLQFIDQVIPGQRFVLAGESYGGYLVRGIVARRAEWIDGVMLLCPMIVPDAARRDVPAHAVFVRDEALLAAQDETDRADFAAISVVQDAYNWQRYVNEILPGAKQADYVFLQKIKQRYAFSFDPDALPQPFPAPGLVLTGRQDQIVGYRDAWRIIEQYPRASFAVLDRAGHNLQVEQPDVFNALVHEWLDRVEEWRGQHEGCRKGAPGGKRC